MAGAPHPTSDASTMTGAAPTGGAWSPPGASWSLFEFARNPYFILVVTYIFAPYMGGVMAGGGAQGQAVVAGTTAIAGFFCAFTAPVLGAMMDRGGKRMPLMAVFLAMIAVPSLILWFATPTGGLGLGLTATLLVTAYCAYTYTEVMHNAMLPLAARPDALPRLSGAGLALGNGASVLGLIIFAVILLNQEAFGLDPEAHEAERLAGPFCAIWLVVFVAPFFIFVPDGARPGGSWRKAAHEVLAGEGGGPVKRIKGLAGYIRRLFGEEPEVMKFLFARMLYADAMAAVIGIGATYASETVGWTPLERAVSGIFGSVFAALGAIAGGWFDRLMGARKAIIIELVLVLVVLVVMLLVDKDWLIIGLIPAGPPIDSLPMFQEPAKLFFLILIAPLTFFITACISSSRYMLVAAAPPMRVAEFFGLFALVGTITVWIGPTLVSVVTATSGSTRAGLGSLALLFIAGIALMLRVKHEGRPPVRA